MITLQRFYPVLVTVILLVIFSGCGKPQTQPLSKEKVLLNVSLADKVRLLSRLGVTNPGWCGLVERDTLGTQIFIRMEPHSFVGRAQNERTQQLVVVTSEGAHVKPWRFPANERVTDDGKVAVWQDPARGFGYQVRSGEWLPQGSHLEDVSGDWIAATAPGRAPWIAQLDTPAVVAAELPNSPGLIQIYAAGQIVHVFARPGWRNGEGPMTYLLYDFSRGSSNAVKQMVMPSWARITLDMDPHSGFVVINDNNRFWGRSWLFDLKTGKRKSISTPSETLIVRKEVAERWLSLTKP